MFLGLGFGLLVFTVLLGGGVDEDLFLFFLGVLSEAIRSSIEPWGGFTCLGKLSNNLLSLLCDSLVLGDLEGELFILRG